MKTRAIYFTTSSFNDLKQMKRGGKEKMGNQKTKRQVKPFSRIIKMHVNAVPGWPIPLFGFVSS